MKTIDSLKFERDECEERVERIAATIQQLRSAWNALCRCNDEFLPNYPEACAECQDRLDTAILAVLKAQETL